MSAGAVESTYELAKLELVVFPYQEMEMEVVLIDGDHKASVWKQNEPSCVLITGSLEVDGDIDLRMPSPGGFLVVLGDLRARHIDLGDSNSDVNLHVGGCLRLSGTMLACGPGGGSVTIAKDAHARALVAVHDAFVGVGGQQRCSIVASDLEGGEATEARAVFQPSVLDADGDIDGDRIFDREIDAAVLDAALL